MELQKVLLTIVPCVLMWIHVNSSTTHQSPFQATDDGALRLVGGSYKKGRVEVYYNGSWGTVCDDDWDIIDAHVVCRQLGFPDAEAVYYLSYLGAGTGKIWIDDVDCRGYESSLSSCRRNPWGRHDCDHSEDAGVSCKGHRGACWRIRWNMTTASPVPTLRSIHNVSRPCNYMEFRCSNGQCIDRSRLCDGDYHCYDGSDERNCNLTGSNMRNTWSSWQTRSCDYWSEFQCKNGQCINRSEVCDTHHHCHDGSDEDYCNSTAVRLVGGSYNEGRVEIYYNGTWGTVCDDGWDLRDARVVCRQLGFHDALNDYQNGYFGEGTGPILFDNVDCLGSESSLFSCRHRGVGNHNCHHSEDASVRCGNTADSSFQVFCDNDFITAVFARKDLPKHVNIARLYFRHRSCRARWNSKHVIAKAPLTGCGTVFSKTEQTLFFTNILSEEGRDQRVGVITRDNLFRANLTCAYPRKRTVGSFRFAPAKQRLFVNLGGQGNFSLSMDVFKSSDYRQAYTSQDYPVLKFLSDNLYIQYYISSSSSNLVVRAETCWATPTNQPHVRPQYVFIADGCDKDETIRHYTHGLSRIHRFSIQAFRFLSEHRFVYLHCDLVVCYKYDYNSTCTRSTSCLKRYSRDVDERAIDASNMYPLSFGPVMQGKESTDQDTEALSGQVVNTTLVGLLIGFGCLSLVLIGALLYMVQQSRRSRSGQADSDNETRRNS